MYEMLLCLEPFTEKKHVVLVNELEEFNIIQFVIKG